MIIKLKWVNDFVNITEYNLIVRKGNIQIGSVISVPIGNEYNYNIDNSINGLITFELSCIHGVPKTITNIINNSGLIRITSIGHGLINNDVCLISGVLGTTEANGEYSVNVIDVDTFDLLDSMYVNAYISGGSFVLKTTEDIDVNVDNSSVLRKLLIKSSYDRDYNVTKIEYNNSPHLYELKSDNISVVKLHIESLITSNNLSINNGLLTGGRLFTKIETPGGYSLTEPVSKNKWMEFIGFSDPTQNPIGGDLPIFTIYKQLPYNQDTNTFDTNIYTNELNYIDTQTITTPKEFNRIEKINEKLKSFNESFVVYNGEIGNLKNGFYIYVPFDTKKIKLTLSDALCGTRTIERNIDDYVPSIDTNTPINIISGKLVWADGTNGFKSGSDDILYDEYNEYEVKLKFTDLSNVVLNDVDLRYKITYEIGGIRYNTQVYGIFPSNSGVVNDSNNNIDEEGYSSLNDFKFVLPEYNFIPDNIILFSGYIKNINTGAISNRLGSYYPSSNNQYSLPMIDVPLSTLTNNGDMSIRVTPSQFSKLYIYMDDNITTPSQFGIQIYIIRYNDPDRDRVFGGDTPDINNLKFNTPTLVTNGIILDENGINTGNDYEVQVYIDGLDNNYNYECNIGIKGSDTQFFSHYTVKGGLDLNSDYHEFVFNNFNGSENISGSFLIDSPDKYIRIKRIINQWGNI